MERRYAKGESVVERKVRDSLILVPLGGAATQRIDCLYTLDEIAGRVWRQATDGIPEDRIVSSIVGEFDVDTETASADCRRVLKELLDIGALTLVEGHA